MPLTHNIQPTVHISRYDVTLEFGGHEEGGWWYDWFEFDRVIATLPAPLAERRAIRLNEEARRNQHDDYGHDYTSVLGGEKHVFLIESTPGANQSLERPHYE